MSEPIDLAALALLRGVVAELEAGRVVVTRCSVHDDHLGARADLAWAPPRAPETEPRVAPPEILQERSISPPSPSPSLSLVAFPCTQCGAPAEEITEDNGGGGYCKACDHSW